MAVPCPRADHLMAKQDECPCGSGDRYRDCCAPYHRGVREPEDPTKLVRARFSAFAVKELAFLRSTLHPSHPDSSRAEVEVIRELRHATATHRYVRLHVLDASPEDGEGVARVLFHAKIFERGKDRSFVELSEFEREQGQWRYARGALRAASDFKSLPALRISEFEGVAEA
ncbi:MAG: YchJ family protein [Myxococcaceae bacterium]